MMIQKNWQELIKPEKQTVDQIVPGYKATLTIEPLERGFGATLGNALRRVMLSSLQGGAVKAVKIAGVQHEFSSIPGVQEDVTEIILNINSLGFLKGFKSFFLFSSFSAFESHNLIEPKVSIFDLWLFFSSLFLMDSYFFII